MIFTLKGTRRGAFLVRCLIFLVRGCDITSAENASGSERFLDDRGNSAIWRLVRAGRAMYPVEETGLRIPVSILLVSWFTSVMSWMSLWHGSAFNSTYLDSGDVKGVEEKLATVEDISVSPLKSPWIEGLVGGESRDERMGDGSALGGSSSLV